MADHFVIKGEPLSEEQVQDLFESNRRVVLDEQAQTLVKESRIFLDNRINNSSEPMYGINTGFGSLYKQQISKTDLEKLQENLVVSHACGTGNPVPDVIVKLMLLFKIQSLAYGNSGIQLITLQRLVVLYNQQIYPVVYEFGSLGASGDLAPLAHLSLPLINLGRVRYQGKTFDSKEINQTFALEPLKFKAKEGLALLNGTQFMSAYGYFCLYHALHLYKLANLVSAISVDAFNCNIEPFNMLIHQLRPHPGQLAVASEMLDLLNGSEIAGQINKQLQDPYSFRCIPQVHGASKDAIDYFQQVVMTEINSVTDNPLVFPEQNKILSGGNFHGQPLALAFDFLAIAMTELGNISERRTFQLISGLRELPDFLIANPGLNSGLMIPQYTAASLLSQCKQLSAPASVDSIVSSNGQEDHVSMGANAALKTARVIENIYSILAIELLTASQAMHFRKSLKTSPYLQGVLSNFSQKVSFIDHDRVFYIDINEAITFLKNLEV